MDHLEYHASQPEQIPIHFCEGRRVEVRVLKVVQSLCRKIRPRTGPAFCVLSTYTNEWCLSCMVCTLQCLTFFSPSSIAIDHRAHRRTDRLLFRATGEEFGSSNLYHVDSYRRNEFATAGPATPPLLCPDARRPFITGVLIFHKVVRIPTPPSALRRWRVRPTGGKRDDNRTA
jgi:hypothetical protein